MGIGGPESFVKITRGRFEIASLLGIENVDTSVEINDIHDRILSVKVQTNAVPAWSHKRQVNSTVGVGQWIRSFIYVSHFNWSTSISEWAGKK